MASKSARGSLTGIRALDRLFAAMDPGSHRRHSEATSLFVADLGRHQGMYVVRPQSGSAIVYLRPIGSKRFAPIENLGPYRRDGLYFVKKVQGRAIVVFRKRRASHRASWFGAESIPKEASAPVKRRVKLRTKILLPKGEGLGDRHFQRVADIGPYVPGFYNVRCLDKGRGNKPCEKGKRGIDPRAVVFRRSATEMRHFPVRPGYPCP